MMDTIKEKLSQSFQIKTIEGEKKKRGKNGEGVNRLRDVPLVHHLSKVPNGGTSPWHGAA